VLSVQSPHVLSQGQAVPKSRVTLSRQFSKQAGDSQASVPAPRPRRCPADSSSVSQSQPWFEFLTLKTASGRLLVIGCHRSWRPVTCYVGSRAGAILRKPGSARPQPSRGQAAAPRALVDVSKNQLKSAHVKTWNEANRPGGKTYLQRHLAAIVDRLRKAPQTSSCGEPRPRPAAARDPLLQDRHGGSAAPALVGSGSRGTSSSFPTHLAFPTSASPPSASQRRRTERAWGVGTEEPSPSASKDVLC